jgi:site-specific recombinase XerD
VPKSKPSTALIPVVAAPLAPLAALADAAQDFVAASKAPATRRAYAAAWRAFAAWCGAHGVEAIPVQPAALALYVTHLAQAGRKVSTIEQAVAAVTAAHKAAGHPNPRDSAAVTAVLAGVRRQLGVAADAKAPLVVAELRAVLASLPETLLGARDHALLAVGFSGALRRSELVGLDVADLTSTTEGVEVLLRRSKTDQEGAGRRVAVPKGTGATCPVASLRRWMKAAGIVEGAVFRSVSRHGHVGGRLDGRDVARAIKRAVEAVGLDAARFSGHSLRAGLATSAAKAGRSEASIARTTGHKSMTSLRRYVRNATLFDDCAAAGLL